MVLVLFATAGALDAGQAAKPGAKGAVVFPHLDAAIGYLKAAQTELQQAEPVFAGHREKALDHVKAAITDVDKAINGYTAAHPDAKRNQSVPETPSTSGAQFPHMEGALKLLQQAETHLNEAWKIYGGERVGALNETKAAIAEIQAGMKVAHK
jgi:hypothetical protein